MTDAEKLEQRANDLIQALAAQRNTALDQIVQVHAELMAANREIEKLKTELANKTKES